MRPYLWFWAVWLIVGAAYEVWAVWVRPLPHDTLSEFTAQVFRSGTTAGFAALMALMTFLLLWFPIHTRRFDKRARVIALPDRLPANADPPRFVYIEDESDADDHK